MACVPTAVLSLKKEEHTMAIQTTTSKTFHYIKGGFPFVGNLPEFNKDRLGLLQRMANTSDVVPDPIHHLAMRPAGAVNVVVKKR